VGSVAHQRALKAVDYDFQRWQDRLRCFVGVPLVLILHALPYIPAILALQQFWYIVDMFCDEHAISVFFLLSPWVFGNTLWISFVVMVISVKRLFIGRLEAGPRGHSHCGELKHWLHGRLVETHEFESACEMFINTEVLSWIYRLLGARVGRRVQIDRFSLVEHDCLTIEDYAVFGSAINMSCDARAPWTPHATVRGCPADLGFEPVRICQGANALDHCVIMPGANVGERAVLGSCTLAHHNSYFAPLTIHTGSVRGRASYLRDYSSSKAVKALEDKALQDLDRPAVWWSFNLFLCLAVLIAKPVHEVVWVLVYVIMFTVYDFSNGWLSFIAGLALLHIALVFCEVLVLIAAKWLIIGRYRAGDFRFFSAYHYRWMVMMLFDHAANIRGFLYGTAFNAWFYRAMGAKVGRNCFLSGLAVEYDLLEIGDGVAIGMFCDTTCHTVENMVIKLAPVRIHSGACLCPFSFAMPGSVVEENAVLLEHTQVLKGETVPEGEVWAGIPAARCQPTAPLPASHGEPQHGAASAVLHDIPLVAMNAIAGAAYRPFPA